MPHKRVVSKYGRKKRSNKHLAEARKRAKTARLEADASNTIMHSLNEIQDSEEARKRVPKCVTPERDEMTKASTGSVRTKQQIDLAVPGTSSNERINNQTTLPDPRTGATFSSPGLQDVLEMGSVGVQSRNPNAQETATILDTIVIKEETPDDEDAIGLDLECENVMDVDVDIKPEPESEPTILNFLREVQPGGYNISQPEPIMGFANLTNTIQTRFSANITKKASTIAVATEPRATSSIPSLTSAGTQSLTDSNVATNQSTIQTRFSANIKKKPSTIVTASETGVTSSIPSFTSAGTQSLIDVATNQRDEAAVSETIIEICILCAKTFNHPLKNVSLLEKRILYTVDLNIKKLQVPKKACDNCITRLELSHKFKRQVAQATKLITRQSELNVPLEQFEELDHSKDFPEQDEEETVEPSPSVPVPEKPAFECIVCDSEFLTYEELQTHDLVEHTKMDCKECDFKTNDIKECLDHKKFHATKLKGDKTKIFCEKCGDTVTRLRYDTHILEHDATKVVECSVCNSSVPDTVLKLHMKKHESNCVCEKCGMKFGGIKAYHRHIIKDHDRTFVCKICDKRFSHQHRLEKHVNLHSGEKPFACTVCDRRFNNKHNLGTHLRIHTNTFPYKCNYCEESFRHNVTRKDHQKKVHPKEWENDKKLLVDKKD